MAATAAWPEADRAIVVESTIVLPVQINGRKRADLEIARDADAQARSRPRPWRSTRSSGRSRGVRSRRSSWCRRGSSMWWRESPASRAALGGLAVSALTLLSRRLLHAGISRHRHRRARRPPALHRGRSRPGPARPLPQRRADHRPQRHGRRADPALPPAAVDLGTRSDGTRRHHDPAGPERDRHNGRDLEARSDRGQPADRDRRGDQRRHLRPIGPALRQHPGGPRCRDPRRQDAGRPHHHAGVGEDAGPAGREVTREGCSHEAFASSRRAERRSSPAGRLQNGAGARDASARGEPLGRCATVALTVDGGVFAGHA